jgi:hypothetical protein
MGYKYICNKCGKVTILDKGYKKKDIPEDIACMCSGRRVLIDPLSLTNYPHLFKNIPPHT